MPKKTVKLQTPSLNLSVIVVNWNTKELLEQCLQSLITNYPARQLLTLKANAGGQLPITNYEIIVVDNGSTDGSVALVKKLQGKVQRYKGTKIHRPTSSFKLQASSSPIKLIVNKINLGFTRANNQALRQAQGEFILLLNSDTIVQKEALKNMLAFFGKQSADVGVVGCRLLNKDGSPQPSAGPFPGLLVSFVMLFFERWLGGRLVRSSPAKAKEVDWVMGAALMVRKSILPAAGLLDESIFMYMDEVEWCFRIRKAGFRVMYTPSAEIIHLGGASSTTGRSGPILGIYKGLRYFYEKHRSPASLLFLRVMLKLKAFLAWLAGLVSGQDNLTKTYAQAWKIA